MTQAAARKLLDTGMGRKLSVYEKDVFRYCNEVLHYVWDPIGVAGSPHARDEYDSYVPGVVSLLLADESAKAVAKHLTQIANESMGLSTSGQHELETAQQLIEWCQLLRDRGPY